ncbi:Tripartite tricarboxylate transporter family receptor [compost metagenome]
MRRRSLLATALLAWSTLCGAQSFPARPITFVVPGVPGGATDTVARALAQDMSQRMGQPVIVDNKPGGNGVVAIQAVTRAAPDGYTLLVSHSTPLINTPYLYPNVPYDVRRDIAFVSEVCVGKLILAVNPNVPANNVQEFLAWAVQNKGKVSFGSYGVGSYPHLVGAQWNQARGLDMTHVAYKGEAPMAQDLMSGNISWAVGSVTTLAPLVKGGRLRALAVMGTNRVKQLPDVPTIAEAGMKDQALRPPAWIGLLAAKGTPPAILALLEAQARASVQSTAFRQRLDALALDPVGSTAAEFRQEFEATEPAMARMIKASGARAE